MGLKPKNRLWRVKNLMKARQQNPKNSKSNKIDAADAATVKTSTEPPPSVRFTASQLYFAQRKKDGSSSKVIGDTVEPQTILEQCVICKKSINQSRKRAPSQSPQELLESLNEVWGYVEAFRNGQHSNNEDDINLGELFGTLDHCSTVVKMPCVCQLCADKIQELSDLIRVLKAKLKDLRRIVIESKKEFGIAGAAVIQVPTTLEKTSDNVSTEVPSIRGPITIIIKQSGGHETEENIVSDNLEIKAENEVEMMEWDTLENFIGEEDPLALNKEDSISNFSATCDDDDDQSWKGSNTQDSSSSSDLDNKGTDSHHIKNIDSAAMDTEIAADVSEVEAEKNDDDDKSSEEEEDATWKLKKQKSPGINTHPHANSSPKKEAAVLTPFKCDVAGCWRSCSTKWRLQRHKTNCHSNPDKTFPCTCGINFKTSHSRLNHFRSSAQHQGEKPTFQINKQTPCDMCGVIVTFVELEAHVRGHVGDYAVKCVNALCPFSFTTFLRLREHLTRYSACTKVLGEQGFEYSCKTCGFKSSKRTKFRNHLNMNHERDPKNRTLKCPIPECTEMFCVRESVHFHLNDKHDMREARRNAFQKCVECSETFETEEMEQHLKSGHQATQIIQCQRCPFVFSSRVHFVDHLYAHRGDVEALVCDVCNDGVKFGKHGALREHYYSAHQIGTKHFICEECGQAFFSLATLGLHKTKHDSKYKYAKKERFRCDLCPELIEFTTEPPLITHKIKVHGADPFRCKVCGETFTGKAMFVKHEKSHLGIQEKIYKCEVSTCGMVFPDNTLLKRHIEIVHKGVRYSCDVCGKTYSGPKSLKSHVKFTHLKVRPFVCDQCGESFQSQNILNNHKLIHTGERPFECTVCGQRFRHQVVLKRHMDGHEKKGNSFKPNGPMKHIRKRVAKK